MKHRDPDDPSLADRRKGLASLLDDRVVHLHVGDLKHAAGRRGSACQVACLTHRHAERLLDQDVLSGLQGAEDLRRMVTRGQEQDRVHVGSVANRAPVGRARDRAGEVCGHAARQRRREITDPRHLEAVAKRQQVRQVDRLPDQAEAHNAEPDRLLHDHRVPSERILGRSTPITIGSAHSKRVAEWEVRANAVPMVSITSHDIPVRPRRKAAGSSRSGRPSAGIPWGSLGRASRTVPATRVALVAGAQGRRMWTGRTRTVNAPGPSNAARRDPRAEPGHP